MRPRAKTLDFVELKPGHSLRLLRAEALYAVCRGDVPISLRNETDNKDRVLNCKYVRTAFPNFGHAAILAWKLNTRFKTTEFCVRKFAVGEEIPLPERYR